MSKPGIAVCRHRARCLAGLRACRPGETQATVGSYYKAVFAVPHGCAGSATVKIRVQIPEGVIGVKPMPKAGWNLETVKGKYASEYELHGSKLSEGVKEVVWSGGKLADDNYDEFVVSHS